MPDGQALQAGTTHNLGQHFTKAFDIKYLDEDNTEKHPWGTSWGVSTRLIGGLIMTHGDDKGMFMPPRVAPTQVVIVPILFGKNDEAVLEKCRETRQALSSYRVLLDDSQNQTAGWKFNEYEMRGIPVRLEIGPKDVQKNQCVLVPRDDSGKRFVPLAGVAAELERLLGEVQAGMLTRSREFVARSTSSAATIDEFKAGLAARPGYVRVHWCGSQECENRLIEETKTTPRNMPAKDQGEPGKCIVCAKDTKTVIYYARTY
jgi:prolyl-tRNA synthetase